MDVHLLADVQTCTHIHMNDLHFFGHINLFLSACATLLRACSQHVGRIDCNVHSHECAFMHIYENVHVNQSYYGGFSKILKIYGNVHVSNNSKCTPFLTGHLENI